MFIENTDYVIFRHPGDDVVGYDRIEIVRRMRDELSKPESSINALRDNDPETASATTGNDVDAYGYVPAEYDDSVEAAFQSYLHSKMLQYGDSIIGKTGSISYNNFVIVRIGGGCSLLSHIHPEDNDGICVIALENTTEDYEFILTETGAPFRAKDDIPESERISLYLKTGDMLILKPEIEHLLPTSPMGSETVYMAINFRFD